MLILNPKLTLVKYKKIKTKNNKKANNKFSSRIIINLNQSNIQLCQDLCNTPFDQTFPRKSPENPGKVRKIKQ
jgi:hypothetical protein